MVEYGIKEGSVLMFKTHFQPPGENNSERKRGTQKMNYDVRIYPIEDGGKVIAGASLEILGAEDQPVFVVTGLRLINGANGRFVSMPSRKLPDGTYKDIAFPLSKDMREDILETVSAVYDAEMAERAEKAKPTSRGRGGKGGK